MNKNKKEKQKRKALITGQRATLTKVEQKLMRLLTPETLVTTGTLRELNNEYRIASEGYFRRSLGSLIHKGVLIQIKKGLYIVTVEGKYDPFSLGQHMYGGYLGFSTALWLWGLKTEEPYDCYVVVTKSKGGKKIGNIQYKAIGLGKKAVGSVYLKNYRISSRAKTFFDCFLIPKYAGGIMQIIVSLKLAKLKNEEWKELLRYLESIGTKSVVQRIGYVLSALLKNKEIAAPSFVMNSVKRMSKKAVTTVLDPSRPRKGKFIKEWKIYDNVGIEKLIK